MKSIRCRLSAARCVHFKSGDCTSPVKCKYQTEFISVKFPDFMPTKEAWEKMQAELARLTAENAELRARLDKTLPCKAGDTIYQTDTDGIRIFKSTVKSIIFETDGVAFDERAIGESIFLTEEAVKEKMKKLQEKTMTEREKMAQIIAEHLCPQGKAHKTLYGAARRCYSRNNFADCEKVSDCVDALIAANIGDVTEWKERAEKHRVIALPGGKIKQLYSNEEVEQIAKERDELKERAGSEIKSCYKEIAQKRDEIAKLRKQLKRTQNAVKKQKNRAEVAERALVIIAERVLEYAQKAKVTAMTSGGLFSYGKDAQLVLLVNDALLKAEQKMARKENNESDF